MIIQERIFCAGDISIIAKPEKSVRWYTAGGRIFGSGVANSNTKVAGRTRGRPREGSCYNKYHGKRSISLPYA
jgi:hypothetical protein